MQVIEGPQFEKQHILATSTLDNSYMNSIMHVCLFIASILELFHVNGTG